MIGSLLVPLDGSACIVHTAGATGADLVALAAHGRSELARVLLGSLADKVVRSADLPVLVYRPTASEKTA